MIRSSPRAGAHRFSGSRGRRARMPTGAGLSRNRRYAKACAKRPRPPGDDLPAAKRPKPPERILRMRPSTFAVPVIALLASAPVQAQDYPTKPVQLISPAAAGNSPDVVTRIVADKLGQ